MNELASYIDGLLKSSKTLKDELMSQTNLGNLRQLEYKSYYYQELIEGLQIFEKVERMIEEVEFLCNQNNILSASVKFKALKKYVNDQPEIKQMLMEFGIQEMIKKRIGEKQRILQDMICQNLLDLLFVRNEEACKRKLSVIQTYFENKLSSLEKDQQILEYISKEMSEIKKIQEQVQKIHNKEIECANKANELIDRQLIYGDEAITTGLLFLQKDYQKAIEDQNVAYLTLLAISYKNVSEDSIQDYLRSQIENQMQGLIQRIIEILIKNKQKVFKNRGYMLSEEDIISELIQIDGKLLKQVTLVIQSIFFFFQQNLSFFMIIDKQDQSQTVENSISLDYVNVFFYYFKFLIQILFDHDKRIKDFNTKNGITEEIKPIQKKPLVEKNLRFSFRNKEEMESFLVDSVRIKLDFYKTMEEMLVPAFFKKNISFVMTLGTRLITMIEGIVDMVDFNFSKDSQNKQQIQAFKGWMKRFIVTNYEIYLDYYKQHSEFVAQKYFSKSLNPQNLIKIGIQDEKVVVNQSQIIQQTNQFNEIRGSMLQVSKASIIGKINSKTNDTNSLWAIFDYVESFSYVSQLAVERIPLEDKSNQDQAMFRQEILESVNKVMKKVYDKMSAIVSLSFNFSHKDNFFPSTLYQSEKNTYFFKSFIKGEELKSDKGQAQEQIEEQEFLFKPKLAIQNELLSNSMTTLTLLMQIYQKLNEVALKEFNSCYQFITSQKQWEQMLSENIKKEYFRYNEGLQMIVHDILIFLRCEFTARAFSHMREMTRIDFAGVTTSSSRVEPFVQSLLRDLKILNNFISQYLGQSEVFYLLANLQKLVFKLYGYYVRFIKRQEIDEVGFQRLKKSLFQLKVEFDLIVPKMLGQSSPSIKKAVELMRNQIAREYEKTSYSFYQLSTLFSF